MTEGAIPRKALTAITVDTEIQQRAVHIDDAVVDDYAERISAGDAFPTGKVPDVFALLLPLHPRTRVRS